MSGYQPYPEYKESGVEWLGEVPKNWEPKRLRFALRTNPSSKEIKLAPEDLVSFVVMDAVGEYGGLRLDAEKELSEVGSGYTFFANNDVVVAKITPCFENGKGALAENLINGIAFGTTELHVLRSGLNLDPEYLFYITISNLFRSLGESEMYGAGGQKRVPEAFIKDFVAALPSLPEQQTIARFLDHKTAQIDALIANKQTLLEKLAEKRTALISHAVTKGLDPNVKMKDSGVEWLGKVPEHWDVVGIKQLTVVKRGASPRPIDDPKYFDDEGEYSWVRIADVSASDRYLESTIQNLSDLGKGLSVTLEPGALFLSIAGTVGKPIITKIKCCIHDGFVYFPTYAGNTEFLYYIFFCGQPYLGLGKMGTQLNLNTDTVGSIRIGFPPVREQEKIVAFLDAVTARLDLQVQKVKAAIEKLQEYRSALITQAVTGKIDVRYYFANSAKI
jgi:type I restriction enzyme S subunit